MVAYFTKHAFFKLGLFAMTTSQIELADPPQDGISSVHFCPSADGLLLTTSWDKVRFPWICCCCPVHAVDCKNLEPCFFVVVEPTSV